MDKKTYDEPTLTHWGSLTELTQTGLTHPGADAKTGSAASNGQ